MKVWWVIAVIAVSGCMKQVPAGVEPEKTRGTSAAAYYPLAVGNAWEYQVQMLGQSQNIGIKVLKEENGFFEDSSGAQITTDAFGVRDQKRYLLREPIEVGTQWTNVVSVSSIERYQIVQVAFPCTVPAGHYENCVTVESRNRVKENTVLVNEITFAPGVGMVRISTVLENNGNKVPQSTLELKKFTPAAAVK